MQASQYLVISDECFFARLVEDHDVGGDDIVGDPATHGAVTRLGLIAVLFYAREAKAMIAVRCQGKKT